jgi:hypothetical protein
MNKNFKKYFGLITVALFLLSTLLPLVGCGGGKSEFTSVILRSGNSEWHLISDTIDTQGELTYGGPNNPNKIAVKEGYVLLRTDFTRTTGDNLVTTWNYRPNKESEANDSAFITNQWQENNETVTEVVYINGLPQVYVTDATGINSPAVAISNTYITFMVPKDSHDFTLHFMDAAPVPLGK